MNENDRKLISKAFTTDEWTEISELESQAESNEAKSILHDRKVHLYHKEESFAELI